MLECGEWVELTKRSAGQRPDIPDIRCMGKPLKHAKGTYRTVVEASLGLAGPVVRGEVKVSIRFGNRFRFRFLG